VYLRFVGKAREQGETGGRELVKMSVLAKRSSTPAATLKHYVREGLIEAAVRSSKNMALYDAALVTRIRAIKELQRTRFLPLRVIRKVFDSGVNLADDATIAAAIGRVLEREGPTEKRTRTQLLAGGLPPELLDWLEHTGLVAPRGRERVFTGDDLTLLRLLGAARKAGLTPEMLPFSVLETYANAIQALVRAELEVFRAGVLPRGGADLPRLTEAAANLSERLVVLLRRKLLLPTLEELSREGSARKPKRVTAKGRARASRG